MPGSLFARESLALLAVLLPGCPDVYVHRAPMADVISVEVTGKPGAYTFAVGISSPDTGCAQYADWWEVLDEDGTLLFRRVLSHSHVDEQPFVRSGGPVAIEPGHVVYLRAHLHPEGYGGTAWKGSVEGGFTATDAEELLGVAYELAREEPQPPPCRF